MKRILSSFFGRVIGKKTAIKLTEIGIEISTEINTEKSTETSSKNSSETSTENNIETSIEKNVSYFKWEELPVPPQFHLSFFGQILSFKTSKQSYAFSMLRYQSKRIHQQHIQQLWANVHIKRVESLLNNIEKICSNRYLRQSHISTIESAATKELAPWLSWPQPNSKTPAVSEKIQQLTHYKNWHKQDIHESRERYINQQLAKYENFFDNVESKPLTLKQRRACIIDNNNNLLLAGAGTGKTSVMVGRAGYLIHSEQASHNKILLLAYGRKAANEMDERIKDKLKTNNISATTFHSLGLSIIAQVEGKKPSLSIFAEDEKVKSQWIQAYFEQLISENPQYRALILVYFSKYYYVEKHDFEFKSLGERHQYYNDNDIRTLKGEKVKSFGELNIANWLFTQGITYHYEAKYIHNVSTVERQQYQPDFFLPELNVYIEYYGIDENGDTAPYINKAEYHESIKWKHDTHEQFDTTCLVLTYALHKKGQLLSHLEALINQQISNSSSSNTHAFEVLTEDAILAVLRESGKMSVLSNIFTQLVGLYKAACLNNTLEHDVIANSTDPQQTEKAFQLLKPILHAYESHLNSTGDIDFEDMINKALTYVQTGQFKSPWRYIMVDEFQDISEPRARLVKALRDNNKECSVFAVGDDWQAIYRFSGADFTLTTQFEQYFGATTLSVLDQTFRFNNQIGKVATNFITKNPAQISKVIKSLKQVKAPAVSLLKRDSVRVNSRANSHRTIVNEMENGAIDDVLMAISSKVCKPVKVYILARFWFLLPDKTQINRLNKQHPLLTIESQSFHTSKGKEADYVIILGLTKGVHGFPSEKVTPALIDALLAKKEAFKYAEERRLFYVALTRAKDRAYVIADMTNASCFVKELIEDANIECNEFESTVNQECVNDIQCLVCETGVLKKQTGAYGAFYSCSHFPRCNHKEKPCVKCESPMTRSRYQGFKLCLNDTCKTLVPTCEKCNAEMVLRTSKNGEFWGCKNYKGNEPTSCKNGLAPSKINWPELVTSSNE